MSKTTKQSKPSKMPDTISGQLLWHIRNSGASTYRLQKETGVHNSVLSRFLRGERGLSLESIDALAKHLGLRLIREED